MRVVHVSAYYAPAFSFGGPPRSIHGLCRALVEAGCDVEVLTTDADGADRLPASVRERREFEGVLVRYFARSRPFRIAGSRDLAAHLGSAVRHADVVHIHGLWNRVVWAAARSARAAGVPYVLSPRGMLDAGSLRHHRWRKALVYPFADRPAVRNAAVLHATSSGEADGIRRRCPSARIEVIPNGIDPEPRGAGQTRESLGLPADGPLIASVSRLHPVKRLDLLVDAFADVRRRHPDARLVIAGPDEQGLRPSLEARAGAAASAIVWMGQVDEDRRDGLLRHAAAFAMCSDSESFGLAALEAMRAGAPVLVTDTCGWPSVAEAGAGLVVPQTRAAIADGLSRLLADPAARRLMGERGQALARQAFGWPAVAARFTALYGSIPRSAGGR
ncbi:MAG: glycosyltransferase [Alphaproteobacteria bacterium]